MLEGLCFKHTDVYNYIKYYTNQDGQHSGSAAGTHHYTRERARLTSLPNAPCWLPGFAYVPSHDRAATRY